MSHSPGGNHSLVCFLVYCSPGARSSEEGTAAKDSHLPRATDEHLRQADKFGLFEPNTAELELDSPVENKNTWNFLLRGSFQASSTLEARHK